MRLPIQQLVICIFVNSVQQLRYSSGRAAGGCERREGRKRRHPHSPQESQGGARGVQRIPRLPRTLPPPGAPHPVPSQPSRRLLVQPGVHAWGSRSRGRRRCHPRAACSQAGEARGLPFRPGREGGAGHGEAGAGRTGHAEGRVPEESSASLQFTRTPLGGPRPGSVEGKGEGGRGRGRGAGAGGGPG